MTQSSTTEGTATMRSKSVIITALICATLIALAGIGAITAPDAPSASPGVATAPAAIISLAPSSAAPRAMATMVPSAKAKGTKITEDDPNFNCLTMGNHRCGPSWARSSGHHINCIALEAICIANLKAGATWTEIPQAIDGHHPCAQLLGDTTLYACSDGYLTSS